MINFLNVSSDLVFPGQIKRYFFGDIDIWYPVRPITIEFNTLQIHNFIQYGDVGFPTLDFEMKTDKYFEYFWCLEYKYEAADWEMWNFDKDAKKIKENKANNIHMFICLPKEKYDTEAISIETTIGQQYIFKGMVKFHIVHTTFS